MSYKIEEKLVKNTETNEVKTPGIFTDLKKWRLEHGLDSPEFNAYRRAINNLFIITVLLAYALGCIATLLVFKSRGI